LKLELRGVVRLTMTNERENLVHFLLLLYAYTVPAIVRFLLYWSRRSFPLSLLRSIVGRGAGSR
jgi:hypothetical protein